MFAFLSLYLFRYSPLSLSSPFPTFAVLDVGFEWFCGLRGGGWFPVSLFYLFLPFLSLSLAVILDFVSCFFFFSSSSSVFCLWAISYFLLLSSSFSFSLFFLFIHHPLFYLPSHRCCSPFYVVVFLSFFGQFYKMELTANDFFPKRLNFLFPFSVPLLFLSSMSSYLPPRPISSPRPPLPLLPDISSTSSLHHLLVHAFASSPRPPLPPFVAVNTYSFDISSFYSPSSF